MSKIIAKGKHEVQKLFIYNCRASFEEFFS